MLETAEGTPVVVSFSLGSSKPEGTTGIGVVGRKVAPTDPHMDGASSTTTPSHAAATARARPDSEEGNQGRSVERQCTAQLLQEAHSSQTSPVCASTPSPRLNMPKFISEPPFS